MMIMINCFCGIVDRRKACGLISSGSHCQRSWRSRISDTPLAGFQPAQNLSSGFVQWSWTAVITIPLHYAVISKIALSSVLTWISFFCIKFANFWYRTSSVPNFAPMPWKLHKVLTIYFLNINMGVLTQKIWLH